MLDIVGLVDGHGMVRFWHTQKNLVRFRKDQTFTLQKEKENLSAAVYGRRVIPLFLVGLTAFWKKNVDVFVHCLVRGRWTAGLLELSEKWEGIKPATFLPVKTKRTSWKTLKCSIERTVTVKGSSLWATTSCFFIVPEKSNLKRKTKTIKTCSQSCSFSSIFSQIIFPQDSQTCARVYRSDDPTCNQWGK